MSWYHRLKVKNILQNERGATIVEAAISFPLYFALLFGFILWGIYLWERNTMQYAAFQVARCGALPVFTQAATNTRLRHCGFDTVNYQNGTTSLEQDFGILKSYGLANVTSSNFTSSTSTTVPLGASVQKCVTVNYDTRLKNLNLPSLEIFTNNTRMGTVCFQN